MTKICADRVAIVTGAGAGLGRGYALELARQGAKVVVNDLNAAKAGEVVQEIVAAGGHAIADSHDIADFEAAGAIVRGTIEKFGDLHAVINNAGVVRDRMFATMSEAEWDLVMKVHLKGHFCVSRHAVNHWRDQSKAGVKVNARILNTSSGAGLQGSVGQSNYAAAKAGIATLTLVQAVELGRYGITSNGLVPAARTAMTEGPFAEIMRKPTDGSFDYYDPENVAPLVAFLVSASASDITGQLFEIEGDKIAIAEGWHTGPVKRKGSRWEAGELGAAVRDLAKQARPPQKVFGS